MKKILVTGGAGFLGNFLCRRLMQHGHDVLCVDNLYTGSKNNISDLVGNPKFEFVRKDIIEPLSFEVDEIYNLACPASPVHYQRDPVQTVKTNVHGSINLLDLAKRLKAKILLASTSEVYGDPTIHPQSESYFGNVNTVGPRSNYDEGKRCAETLFHAYRTQYGVNTKIVRIFNTYGPNMDINDGRVISNFIVQALRNQPITIYGEGKQTRSFQYVDDMIDGFIAMMESEHQGPVNIGNPGEYTMLELASEIIKLTGSKSELTFKPMPQDDPKQRCPDISLAKKLLNWEPKVCLQDGLVKTIEYFKKVI